MGVRSTCRSPAARRRVGCSDNRRARPSFGTIGTVTTSLVGPEGDSPANALLLQPDGKLVAVGDSDPSFEDVPESFARASIALVRYTPDGSHDLSFGNGGVVTTSIPGGYAFGNAAVLQPDGKIVVAGYYWPQGPRVFALVRYNPDGSLDPTFGTNGIVTTYGRRRRLRGVRRRASAGRQNRRGRRGDRLERQRLFALVRYNPDGTLDTSFGSGGTVLDTQAGENGFAGIALQPNGKILGVGQRSSAASPWTTTPLTRFDSDGTRIPPSAAEECPRLPPVRLPRWRCNPTARSSSSARSRTPSS